MAQSVDTQRKTCNLNGLQVFLFWQGMRDSNPRKRSQSPVCYRYTNPLKKNRAETQVLLY